MKKEERQMVRNLYHLEKDKQDERARVFTNKDEYSREYVNWLETQCVEYVNNTFVEIIKKQEQLNL